MASARDSHVIHSEGSLTVVSTVKSALLTAFPCPRVVDRDGPNQQWRAVHDRIELGRGSPMVCKPGKYQIAILTCDIFEISFRCLVNGHA